MPLAMLPANANATAARKAQVAPTSGLKVKQAATHAAPIVCPNNRASPDKPLATLARCVGTVIMMKR